MVIGVLRCTDECLVPLVPKVVAKLIKDGYEVNIEAGAGEQSLYSDTAYSEFGATIVSRETVYNSDIILTVSGIAFNEISKFKKHAFVVGKFNARVESALLSALRESKQHVFSLDLLPRSTIAQSMDVLSSLASLSGYKAVILAADHFGGYLPMMTTSAGTIPPAKVMILGAGVAGLQAIATARRLGAMVDVFDVRSAVKEEVQSLGGKFIEVEGAQEDAAAGGYAVEQSEVYKRKQKELIHQTAIKADVIITTANIPGKSAPKLIEQRTVEAMKSGAVIVDMASASGGNVALSKDNQTINQNGLTLIGDSKLYDRMGMQSSFVYSNNIYSFLSYVLKDGIEKVSYDNEIVSNTLITSNHKI